MLDFVGVLNAQEDYTKNRNYWKYLKGKLKTDNPELVSGTNQFKLRAPDGKMRLTDVLDASGVNDREMFMKGIDCIAKRLAKSRKKVSYGILRKDSEKIRHPYSYESTTLLINLVNSDKQILAKQDNREES